MFDNPQIDPAKTADWKEHLAWGHIVLYRFPIRLPGENEKPPSPT